VNDERVPATGENMPSDGPQAASEEREVKAAELEVRRGKKGLAAIAAPWWRRADAMVLAIRAGVLTLLGNMAVTVVSSHSSLVQEQKKVADDLALEQAKARYNLVLQAMATNDAGVARRNIHFFIDAGLLHDPDCRIRDAIDQDQPVLPSLSGVAPQLPAGTHSAPEIATLYNFPSGLDGRVVTIGILELGGSIIPSDIETYFKSLDLPEPDITPVYLDGAKYDPGTISDSRVMADVEIIGAIAPRAHLRVYFAPNVSGSIARMIEWATSDGIEILSLGWGKPEFGWNEHEFRQTEAALERAAKHDVTVVTAIGCSGVDFPASSEWVLAVGGTALKSKDGQIVSETAGISGAGLSEKVERPAWQSKISMPNRSDGKVGRGIPEVVGSAAPQLGMSLIVQGKPYGFGGTSEAVPLWVGLIARIDQALGYSVGHLNPRLYNEIGPAGILRVVTAGDNAISGWSPVAGWGSPDGVKLLRWLQDHPTAKPERQTARVACQPK
jgi:hypothetical protein